MMRVPRESENEAGLSSFVKFGRQPPSIHILKVMRNTTYVGKKRTKELGMVLHLKAMKKTFFMASFCSYDK